MTAFIETIRGHGSRTFICREYPDTLARLRSIRRVVSVGESFRKVARRDARGRFAGRAVA